MEFLQNALDRVVAVAPKILLFLLILVVGWIVAMLLAKAVDKLLSMIGFDRVIERSGLRRWMGTYDPSQLFSKLVYYGILLVTLQMAFGVFGPNPVSDIINAIVAFLPLAFVALVIVVISAAIASAVKDVIVSALGGLSYSRFLGVAAQVFILGLGIIAALNQMGIALTVTMPVLIAVLATIGGVIIVGAGGGLIMPMRDRWERWLARGEAEMSVAKSQLAATQQTTAATPQPSYQAQGAGAAVDPTHPRAAQPATGSATPTTGASTPATGSAPTTGVTPEGYPEQYPQGGRHA